MSKVDPVDLYRSMFENAIEGIFQTTPSGQYLNVNSALAKMYGYATTKELVEGLTGLGPEQEHLPRVAVQELPGPRRDGLPAQAVEQPRAQLLLEEPHVLADRGLGEAERRGRPGEAAELEHTGEDLELAQVHETSGRSRQASAPRARASSRKRRTFRSFTSS